MLQMFGSQASEKPEWDLTIFVKLVYRVFVVGWDDYCRQSTGCIVGFFL
jgi:hypothetical protein